MRTVWSIPLWLLVAAPASNVVGQTRDAAVMGMGMVKPEISPSQALYFHGPPANTPFANPSSPVDSLTFKEGQYYIDIASAPPWFQPEVMKLDYDLLYLRAMTIRRNWIEVVVNKTTGQTAWVDQMQVQYSEWSSFLLNVFAVEPLDSHTNPVRVRPFDASDLVRHEAEALYPLAIRGSWMQVMLDMDGNKTGWIKWRDGDILLVAYSLLS